jgi:hypothetical protein
MRIPIWPLMIAIVVGLTVTVLIGQALVQPDQALIVSAEFADDTITPNADGDNDLTRFSYELSRNASVSLRFEAQDGTHYDFRQDEPRLANEYSLLFSGVVDGYTLSDEDVAGDIQRRLMPNGVYTWRLSATDVVSDETQESSGTLTITDADSPLPEITTFTVGPQTFTPNQDGRDDRVKINVYLKKAADLRVFLIDDQQNEIPISARLDGSREAGDEGRHIFDYEGGIDLNADPPPDGTYTVVAVAQDDEGQRIRQETELTILNGGKPRAEIAAQPIGVDVVFAAQPYDERFFSDDDALGDLVMPPDDPDDLAANRVVLPVDDMLVFKLTVDNYSAVPIRTTYPPPGTVYQQGQLPASLGAFESPGAWRVGIQCETSTQPYPYRWAVGAPDVLASDTDPETGETFYYLPAGASATVWGAIRFTELNENYNPQVCRAALIHESVAISQRNAYVGPREVLLVAE